MSNERPANGTRRAQRVAVLYALIEAYPDVKPDPLRVALGWTEEEMEEALTDLKVVAKELTIAG